MGREARFVVLMITNGSHRIRILAVYIVRAIVILYVERYCATDQLHGATAKRKKGLMWGKQRQLNAAHAGIELFSHSQQ